MNRKLTCSALMVACILGTTVFAAPKVSLEGIKCLMVAKKDASEEKSAKWKDGQVYFCCDGCLGKFTKLDDEGKEKFAAKANHQLIATKQYVQAKCPFSGGDLTEGKTLKVAGAEVGFCCDGCLAKAKNMKGDKQIEALFGEKAFEKAGYKLAKKEEK